MKPSHRSPLLTWLTLMSQPRAAGLVALIIYLLRASLSPTQLQPTEHAYFNFLADAFLHGQLSLRLPTMKDLDLIQYAGRVYLYWPPFPAILVMPLVMLFGVNVSDVVYTAAFGAVTIALLAQLLISLDRSRVAPLPIERRGIVVAACAFGSVLLILAPAAGVWYTAQVIGLGCVLLATVAALTRPGTSGYCLTGLFLACATATRVSLVFNGVWIAYYLLHRDRQHPWRQQAANLVCGLAPLVGGLLLLGWYNAARFGSPTEMGLAWHDVNGFFRPDFERYGVFSLHYLPTNLYYQFVAYDLFSARRWLGGGLFWMTPILLGAPYALWRGRRDPLTWSLVLSCVLVYLPIGLLMGTGYFTFGPRYLLDLLVPLIVLTARGIRHWGVSLLLLLLLISCATYLFGSGVWLLAQYGKVATVPD